MVMLFGASSVANATEQIVVNAYGTPTRSCTLLFFCTNTYPNMKVYVDGVLKGTFTVTGSNADYITNATLPSSGAVQIDVLFDNDQYCSADLFFLISYCGGDRNLGINSILIRGVTTLPGGKTVDVGGSYTSATDGITTYAYGVGLYENSALRVPLTLVAPTLTPVATYHLDEDVLAGTVGEVNDSSASSIYDAKAGYKSTATTYPETDNTSAAITGATGTCGYGVFAGSVSTSSQFIDLPSTFPKLSGEISVSAWIRTTDRTQGQRIVVDEQTNDGGYGLTLASGTAGTGNVRFFKRFGTGSFVNIDTTTAPIQNNTWYFVAAVMKNDNTGTIYVYNTVGTLLESKSNSTFTSTYRNDTEPTTSRVSIGGENASSSEYVGFQGNIDEVNIFNIALTSTDVNTIRQQTHACPTASLIASYNMEAASWNGTAGELNDDAGVGSYDGTALSTYPDALTTSPARTGASGTCGYASLVGKTGRFSTATLPVDTTANKQTTVSFWIDWDGTANKMPIGWNKYDINFSTSNIGFNTDNGDLYGTSATGLSTGWHHIVAVFTNGSVVQNRLYIDGASKSLSQISGTPLLANAVVQGTLGIGGWTKDTTYRFAGGLIDEVKVYSGAPSPEQVAADYAATHSCVDYTVSLKAKYSMDELTWNGTTGEVLDSSGNGYNATANKRSGALPSTANSSAAISGTTGTCGYGVFTGTQYIDLPASFPNLTNSMTFSTWIRTTDRTVRQRIIADDQNNIGGYALVLSDWNIGTMRFYKRNASAITYVETPAVISNNTWYFVAVSVDSSTSQATIYVYDQSGTQLNKTTGSINYLTSTDTGTSSIGGENLAGEGDGFQGNIDEVNIYSGALSQTQIEALRSVTHTCPSYSVAPSNFNCVVTGGNASTGHLYMQLAGTAFNFDVVALNSSNAVETSYVASGTKNVTVEFVDGSGSTACSSRTVLSPAVSQTLTFAAADAGRKSASATITKAYRDLRCRVTDANQSPTVVGCSSDDFAVRPSNFTVSATGVADADSTGASTTATPKIKAGASFNLTATANVTGYDGTPSIDSTKVAASTGTTGTLSGSFAAASSGTGAAVGSLTYSEVGYFRLAANGVYDSTFAAVDSANSDCSLDYSNSLVSSKYGCYVGNTAATNYFGRFYPDHFAIATGTTTPACSSSFTYFGQDGFTTPFTLTAQNAFNATTQNYTGSFAKLGLTSWSNYNFTAATLPSGSALSASSVAPSGTWSNGVASISAKHQISRPTAATAPTSITVSAAPTDSDGVTMTSSAVSAASNFRFGRLTISNAYGSELLPLSVPIEAQYWNGTAYQRNQLDSCTVINPANVSLGSYKNNLAACETQISNTMPTMSSGKTTFKLSKPGTGNNGSVDLTVNLASVSAAPNNKTCNTSTEAAATATGYSWFGSTNPSARATFGLYKSPVIYMRENY